jgi:tRNA uridine 5-carbamoylmethylation protein Kti12
MTLDLTTLSDAPGLAPFRKPRPVIIVLTGLPASGKSTLRRALEACWRTPGIVVCSTDDYLETTAAALGTTYNDAYLEHSDVALERFNHTLALALSGAHDIIVDRTNLTVAARRRVRAMAPKHYTEISILCDCGFEERNRRQNERNAKGERALYENVIQTMRDSAVAPGPDENFDLRLTDWDVIREGKLIPSPLSDYYTHSV